MLNKLIFAKGLITIAKPVPPKTILTQIIRKFHSNKIITKKRNMGIKP